MANLYLAGKDLKEVSLKVSRLIHAFLISKFTTNHRRNESLISDFIACKMTGVQYVSAGSNAEGTFDTDSDIDKLIILDHIMVLKCSKDIVDNKEQSFFILDTTKSRPGYCMLELCKLQETIEQDISYNHGLFHVQQLLDKKFGVDYLSSQKFLQNAKPKRPFTYIGESIMLTGTIYIHGPCMSTEIHEPDRGSKINKTVDIPFGIQCNSWPTVAREWTSRERKHDWPTIELVNKIIKLPCYVVPIGDLNSPNESLEWRFSFLPAERELVWAFNETQIQCYVVLKRLLKHYIHSVLPNRLSSYQLKNMMFWLIENKGMSMWREDNLIPCVLECINLLSFHVENENLSHYFYRECNLLHNKLQDGQEKTKILNLIQVVKSDPLACILKGFFYENLELLVFLNKFTISERDLFYLDRELHNKYLNDIFRLHDIPQELWNLQNTTRTLKAALENGIEGVDEEFKEMLCKLLLLCVGMQLLERIDLNQNPINVKVKILLTENSSSMNQHQIIRWDRMEFSEREECKFTDNTSEEQLYQRGADPSNRRMVYGVGEQFCHIPDSVSLQTTSKPNASLYCVEKTQIHFDSIMLAELFICIGSRFDPISSCLYLASIYTSRGDFQTANDLILNYISQECTLQYAGKSSEKTGIRVNGNGELSQCDYKNSSSDINDIIPVFDIFFYPWEINQVPTAVKFECASHHLDVQIHPCVYAYYLMSIGYFHSGKQSKFEKYLSKLEQAVVETKGGKYHYRGLNILGHCHFLNGDFENASKCFGQSLLETRNFYQKANYSALYQYLILLMHILDKKHNADD